MDKNHYYAVTKEEDGKQFSYCMQIHGSCNLVGQFDGLKTVNACATRKEAEEVAGFWNECAKKNGKYMYDENVRSKQGKQMLKPIRTNEHDEREM